MNIANRMSLLGTESAFEVLVKARALEAMGHDVVHLEIGEPDFDTPAHIVEAGQRALSDGFTHYGPPVGLPELREAIAEEISTTRQIDVHRDQVVVTPGAKPIMFYSILALAEQGDEVIYPNPGFPIYESVIRFAGAQPVPVPLTEDRGFSLNADQLRGSGNGTHRTHKTDYSKFTAKSHRWRDSRRRFEGDCRGGGRASDSRVVR